jgi:hypothetical protein
MVNQPRTKKGLPIAPDKRFIGNTFSNLVELSQQFVMLNEVWKNFRVVDSSHHVFFVGKMLSGVPEQADDTFGEANCVGHFEQQVNPTKQLLMLGVDFSITYLKSIRPGNWHTKHSLKFNSISMRIADLIATQFAISEPQAYTFHSCHSDGLASGNQSCS